MKNKRNQKKGKIVVWLLLLLVAVGGGFYALNLDRRVEAEFFTTAAMDLHTGIKETGTLEADTTVLVSAKVGGEVTAVYVREGEAVAAGAMLLRIDQSTANQQAQARRLDVQSLEAQEAGLQQEYETAVAEAEKNAQLYEQGVISQEAYQETENAVRRLASEISSLRYSIAGASAAVITESGDVKAPVSGVITAVNIRQGEIAAAGMSLFEVSDLEHLHVKTDLLAEDAAKVSEGQAVIFYDDKKEALAATGVVRKIHVKAQEKVSELGIAQKRVTVEIALAAEADIRLGSDVDLEIITAEKSQVVAVPQKAIFEWNQQHYVYVVQADQAVLRQVETGLQAERYTEVVSGLTIGEIVIVAPGAEISDGVNVKSSEIFL